MKEKFEGRKVNNGALCSERWAELFKIVNYQWIGKQRYVSRGNRFSWIRVGLTMLDSLKINCSQPNRLRQLAVPNQNVNDWKSDSKNLEPQNLIDSKSGDKIESMFMFKARFWLISTNFWWILNIFLMKFVYE